MNVQTLLAALEANPGAGVHLMLPDGDFVPSHFHITEVGRVHKDFIDCGGTVRSTTACALQVWVAGDFDHRLDTSKLAMILRLAGPVLKSNEMPIEIEYENGTVSNYPLAEIEVTPSGLLFILGNKRTACLAPDRCGVGEAGAKTGCC